MDLMELVSVRGAARELGIAERTLHEAVREGELPAFRFGRRTVRIERAALREWVSRRRMSGPERDDGVRAPED